MERMSGRLYTQRISPRTQAGRNAGMTACVPYQAYFCLQFTLSGISDGVWREEKASRC